jgi:hypothetical protein
LLDSDHYLLRLGRCRWTHLSDTQMVQGGLVLSDV